MNPDSNDSRASFTPHLVVGFGLIFVGVVLVLDRLGIVRAAQGLQYWPVGLIALGAAVVVQAMRGSASTPADTRGQFPLGPAILLLIFVMVFIRPFRPDPVNAADGRLQLLGVMSSDRQRVLDEPFRGAQMTAVMGGSEIDLRRATLPPGEPVVVEVFAFMGGTVLRVPPEWTVDIKVTPIMGGAKDERRRRGATDSALEGPSADAAVQAPRLVIRGFVMMGGLVVRS